MESVKTTVSAATLHKTVEPTPLEPFPIEGKVRAKQAAAHLSIGVSTWWLYVSRGQIKQPLKLSPRVSVWDAEYVRELAATGIPAAGGEA